MNTPDHIMNGVSAIRNGTGFSPVSLNNQNKPANVAEIAEVKTIAML